MKKKNFKAFIKVYYDPSGGSVRVYVDGLTSEKKDKYIFLDTAFIDPHEVVFMLSQNINLGSKKMEGNVIYLRNGQRFFSRKSLTYLSSSWEAFMRVHQSYVINIDSDNVGRKFGSNYSNTVAEIGNGKDKQYHSVPIGRSFHKDVKSFFESRYSS